jgi:CheY-like chemotaxis protein
MGSMTPIEDLSRNIAHRLPAARLSVDAPDDASGNWYVDVECNGRSAVVEWRPHMGFGLSFQRGGYGEGPEIVFPSAAATADYLSEQFSGRGKVTALVVSIDAPWRDLLSKELANYYLATVVVSDYSEATVRLTEQRYDVIVIDVSTSTDDEHTQLHTLLMHTKAVVVAVGASRVGNASDEWFEVFVRKAIAPARIASIVESLATAESLAIV